MSKPYSGCVEISRGVFIAGPIVASTWRMINGVPTPAQDVDAAVYIADDEGEIVCWVYAEIKEDAAAWTASMNACAIAVADGPEAVRKLLRNGLAPGVQLVK